MTDVFHRLTKWLDHNRYLAIGLLVAFLPFVLAACGALDGQIASDVTGETSTAAEIRSAAIARVGEFDHELEAIRRDMTALEARAAEIVGKRATVIETANVEIEAANAITAERIDLASMAIKDVAANPLIAGALGTVGLGGLLTIGGLALDNRRKDRLIKTIKAA